MRRTDQCVSDRCHHAQSDRPSVSIAIRSDTTRGRNSFHVCNSENIIDHRGELLGGASFISKPFTKSECQEFAGLPWPAPENVFLAVIARRDYRVAWKLATTCIPTQPELLQVIRLALLVSE